MSAESYVCEVVNRRIKDPTLSFQLRHGFEVLAVVSGYLRNDLESLGYGALIEWINVKVATPEDYVHRNPRFQCAATSTAMKASLLSEGQDPSHRRR